MKSKLILLILVAVSLTMAQGRNSGGQMMTWNDNLNLTTEQMQQITELREVMQPAMMEIRQNTRALELELRLLNRSDDPNAVKITELEAAIANYQTAIDAIMSGHRDQIRTLLTEDQQLIFDQREFGPDKGRGNRRSMRGGDNAGGRRGHRTGNSRW